MSMIDLNIATLSWTDYRAIDLIQIMNYLIVIIRPCNYKA